MFTDEQKIALQKIGAIISPTGSRYICNPPPTDTDEDWLIELHGSEELAHAVHYVSAEGYQWEGSEHYQDMDANTFMSWRNGTANLILTKDAAFAVKHREATELCKSKNILVKADRIAVFQEILYGKVRDGVDDEPF